MSLNVASLKVCNEKKMKANGAAARWQLKAYRKCVSNCKIVKAKETNEKRKENRENECESESIRI